MSLIDDALSAHLDTLHDASVAGEPVVFRRGSSTVSMMATMGKTDWSEATGGDSGETYIGVSSTDFIVRASEMMLGGVRIEPQRGDLVERTNGSIYSVMPGLNSAPSEPADGREIQFRIHTQKRKRADP